MAVRHMAFIMLAVSVANADEYDYKKLKADWEMLVIKERADLVNDVDNQIKEKEAELKKAKKGSTLASNIQSRIDAMKKAKESYAKLEYGLRPTSLNVGDFGKLAPTRDARERCSFKVLQVQDKGAALMKWGDKIFWVEVDTNGMTDDDNYNFVDFAHATGTKTYESLSGKRTVLVLKVVK